MPAPNVAATSKALSPGNVSSLALTMPTGIAAGNLLLACAGIDGDGSTPVATGWTTLGVQVGAGAVQAAVYYKTAAGADTCTITGLNDERVAYHVLRITGFSGAPTGSSAGGDSTTPDSPAHTAGAAGDYLWISFTGLDSDVVMGTFPAGYTNTDSQVGDGSTGASSAIAWRTTASATEDPGNFVLDETFGQEWGAWTIAVAGAAAPVVKNTGSFFPFF